MPRSKKRWWGFDTEAYKLLLAATADIPELRAVIDRARPDAEIAGLLVLRATVDELDEMYTLVEHLADRVRSPRRRELVHMLRVSLSTSIDGF